MDENGNIHLSVPINWELPDGLPTRYASNFLVQRSEHEYILSFFEIKMPYVTGTTEEQSHQLAQIGSVHAECVARIVVSAGRMPEFVRVLANYVSSSDDLPEITIEQ